MWEAGVSIIFVGTSAILAYISFQLGKGVDVKNKEAMKKMVFLQPIKWFLLSLSIVLLILGSGLAINLAEDGGAGEDVLSLLGVSYAIMAWFGVIFVFLMFVYLFWNVFSSIKILKRGDDD